MGSRPTWGTEHIRHRVVVCPQGGRDDETMANDLNASPDLRAMVHAMGESARAASRALARATTSAKNRALEAAADSLADREKAILAANAQDVKAARSEGRDDAFIDRLALTAKAIQPIPPGLREPPQPPHPPPPRTSPPLP